MTAIWFNAIFAEAFGPAIGPRFFFQWNRVNFVANDYFGSLMHERRRQPLADLISALTRVEEQGDRLTGEDLLGLCDQLLTAGHDTTPNLIGNGMLVLLQNEDQLQKLKIHL